MLKNKERISRRELIKNALLGGGALLVAPSCGRAVNNSSPTSGESWQPGYLRLEEEGRLAERVERASEMLKDCNICPQRCGVNRSGGELGFCRAPAQPVVFSHQPHFGEELPLVGSNGSGTIFFSHCSLRCVFCQNYPIAHEGRGSEESVNDLAERMLALQRRGCHNINLVTPTHMMPMILGAVRIACREGLRLPLVYNTGGYERKEIIEMLDGIVDIYMPDVKFMDGEEAALYTGGMEDYPDHATESVREMHRQVGVLRLDENGKAYRGLMIRHLVMPNRVSGPRQFVEWVADTLSEDTYVNIMAQYRVEHEAYDYERIARSIRPEEFLEAMDWAEQTGLTNLDKRSLSQRDTYRRRLR